MKRVVIGFLGLGNIGSGVWRLIHEFRQDILHRTGVEFSVKRVLVRDLTKKRPVDVPQGVLTTDPDDVLRDPEITLIAEFLGGESPADALLLRALEGGKTVVTANKVVFALHWHELQRAAKEHGAGLYYEAAVCGAIPIIHAMNESLQANRVTQLMGIVNGTTNYILTRMAKEGKPYAEVLADAQRLGLAEPDPASDVEGLDAGYKLSILSSLAFHARVPFDKVYCEGITHVLPEDIAFGREMGYALKLIAIAKRDGNVIEVRVHPTFIPQEHPLASVSGAYNAVFLRGHACGEMMFYGRGAGDMPTAGAVVSDMLRAAAAERHLHPTFVNSATPDATLTFDENWRSAYYVRLSARDVPGVLSRIAGGFAAQDISIAAMQQNGAVRNGHVPLVFITHETGEQAMRAFVRALDAENAQLMSLIRVEREQDARGAR